MRWLSILGVYAAACGAGARSATADAGCDAPGPCTGQLSGGLQASVTCTGLFGSNWGHPPFACYPQWTMAGQGPDLALRFQERKVSSAPGIRRARWFTRRPRRSCSRHWSNATKIGRDEAFVLDVSRLRRSCTVLLTDGARRCTVLSATLEQCVAAFPAHEIDPTSAGDCFLAGFAVGLLRGWPASRAARLGN